MTPHLAHLQHVTRRQFLRTGSLGLGAVALSTLLGRNPAAAAAPDLSRRPHFQPRAKRVIYIHLAGSPPNLDLFDYKPELVKRNGQDCPDDFLKGRRFAFTSGVPKLLGSPRTFQQYGSAGIWMSDAIPHFHGLADDICVVNSMYTEQFNHAPAELLLLTGHPRQGRPSMGSWVTYGLGSENTGLPAFMVMISSGSQPSAGNNAWGSGFLPSVHQGVQCQGKGDPVVYVANPPGMTRDLRRHTLNALESINQAQHQEFGNPETLTRIAQFELAYRMQATAPEAMDISQEPAHVLESYGAVPGASSLANNCLLARRLAERDVRFIQLFDWGWDFHGTNPGEDIRDGLTRKCATMDKPVAALIRDLKERGLLDDTLVIWTGEFGRTPFREGRTASGDILGRDHYPDCYSMFMAGGGIKRGHRHGATDELGFGVTENGVHVHDLQATILHLLGVDHEKLTYRHQGRDFRLTDVHGHVVKSLLA
jgi:Protein of unknown function (DUF1501)